MQIFLYLRKKAVQGRKPLKRRVLKQHLASFPWLAISKHPDYIGCWCVYCVIFHTSEWVGKGKSLLLGRLIKTPMIDHSDLTGKSGALTRHHERDFHRQKLPHLFNT